MKVIISGGGTGGHIYPALAIAQGICAAVPAEILYVGAQDGMEQELAARAGFKFTGVSVAPLPRALTPALFKSVGTNLSGLRESKKIIREFQPDIVIGTGGYVCGVVILAGKMLHIPALLHEQNAVMGLTNRWLSRVVDCVCLTFEEARATMKKPDKGVLTGLPVRQEVLTADRVTGCAALGLDPARQTLLVTGGSQGARKINQAVYPLWASLLEKGIQVIHIVGNNGYAEAQKQLQEQGLEQHSALVVRPFCHEMYHALAAADLVLGRAGASFMAEIMARGIPSILVPYPFAAGNHQEANARSLAKAGGAIMLADSEISAYSLAGMLLPLLADNAKLKAMSQAAAQQGACHAVDDIVKEVLTLTAQRG